MISKKLCYINQYHLGGSWCIVTTSQFGRVFLRTNETLQKRLK